MESDGSKLLKLLSVFSDPFKLTKEHHLLPSLSVKWDAFKGVEELRVSNKNGIQEEFCKNHTKLFKWKLVWDLFIDPIVLELIGFVILFFLISAWSVSAAWITVLILALGSVAIEAVMAVFRKKDLKKQIDRFNTLLLPQSVYVYCYDLKS